MIAFLLIGKCFKTADLQTLWQQMEFLMMTFEEGKNI